MPVIDALIEMSPPEQGYCQMCSEPGKVGGLRIKGWAHKLLICADCLRKLAAGVEKG